MYVHMYVESMYVCVCIYVCTFAYMYKNLCMYVCVYMYCVSVRTKHLGSQWTDFYNTWYFMIFPKICTEISNYFKIRQHFT